MSQQQFPISAAAAVVGVSTHTLRKWETRHQLVVPERTDSGRRYYNEAQLRRLQLIKQLSGQGHTLPSLARLSDDEMSDLAEEYPQTPAPRAIQHIDLVGSLICRRLKDWGRLNVVPFAESGAEWLHQTPGSRTQRQALIIELPTLSTNLCQKLVKLREEHYERIIVIARMSSRQHRRELTLQNIDVLEAMVPIPALLSMLGEVTMKPAVAQQPRFSQDQLASIAAMNPALDCECPNHIAQLLIDISAFEQYCGECEDSDPKEKALHAHLAQISGNARQLFEQALEAVAEADNITL